MASRLRFDLGLAFMNAKEVFTRTFVNLIGVPLEPTLICRLFCILLKKKKKEKKLLRNPSVYLSIKLKMP